MKHIVAAKQKKLKRENKEKRKQTQMRHQALSVHAQFEKMIPLHPCSPCALTWQLHWGLTWDLSSQTVPAQCKKPECCKANWQGTPSTTIQEDSCSIIGIYIFVLIVLLQNTSVKLQRMYLTPIADRLFLRHSPKQCFVCLLFATRIIHALTQFTITFICVTVALSARG